MKLYPLSLVREIMRASEHAIAMCADRPLLLVRIPEDDLKLAHWLEETTRGGRLRFEEEEPGSGGRITFGEEETSTRVSPAVDSMRMPPPAPRSTRKPRAFGTAVLENQLATGTHFGMTLAKREAMALDSRIRVGRSKSSDVVLYHKSVSATHAYIEPDRDGVMFRLMDHGSTNGTRLNGEKLTPMKVVLAEPGDMIKFGDVETMLCPLGMLRAVLVRLHDEPPKSRR